MSTLQNAPDERLRVLVVTAGHSFEAEPFFAMFDADDGIRSEGTEQPGAWSCFGAGQVGNWDAIVMYDMPGLRFVGGETIHVDPPEYFQRHFLEMLEAGQGFVFLHHAMSAWPSWPAYADIALWQVLYHAADLKNIPPRSGMTGLNVTPTAWPGSPQADVAGGRRGGLTMTWPGRRAAAR